MIFGRVMWIIPFLCSSVWLATGLAWRPRRDQADRIGPIKASATRYSHLQGNQDSRWEGYSSNSRADKNRIVVGAHRKRRGRKENGRFTRRKRKRDWRKLEFRCSAHLRPT